MSERISIVVPNGTRQRLKNQGKCQGRAQSNLVRLYIIDGLQKDEQKELKK